MVDRARIGTRVIALGAGPAGAGKTSLAEADAVRGRCDGPPGIDGQRLQHRRLQPWKAGSSPRGSTELNLYKFEYLGDLFALLDSPGSIGFAADGAWR